MVKVPVFLPPNVIKQLDARIPGYGSNRSQVARLVMINWVDEGWALKKVR